MPISVTNPTNGTVMSWTSMATAFATMRTWLNAVPNGDVAAGAIEREHLVRPAIAGFPVQGMRSDFREHRWRTSNLTGGNLYGRDAWSIPEKVVIIPDAADRDAGTTLGGGERFNTPIGAPLYGVGEKHRVWFSCSAMARMDPAVAGLLTPPIVAGQLQLVTLTEGELPAVVPHAIARVYCGEWSDDSDDDASSGTLMHRVQLFGLVHDSVDWVYIAFRRTRDDVDQVDLTRIAFHVEVF